MRDSSSRSLGEKCGIFGVYSPDLVAARLTYFGLFSLQHRGQEGSGIVSTDGEAFYEHKNTGLVSQVYDESDIEALHGTCCIGHNRYSTSQGNSLEHIQPFVYQTDLLALAHNGNLPSVKTLVNFLTSKGVKCTGKSDSWLMGEAIAYYLKEGKSLKKALELAYPLFTGAFSLLVMTKNAVAALRDPLGIRPLCYGRLNHGYIFASESCALETVQAKFVREVKPGELIIANQTGLHSYQLAKPNPKFDIFEFIYFSRPDTNHLGRNVDEVRRNFGRELATLYPIKADLVIPVPDSGIPAALGYAHQSGLPFYFGLIKNRYIGRTFIAPEQHLRDRAVEMKLNPLTSVLKGKRVIVIDDSIVRGTTSCKIVAMLRRAGAKEVHFMVSSPPYRYPDFYGIDTPVQSTLLAYRRNNTEICQHIGCDSLHYLPYENVIKAIGLPAKQFCAPSLIGEYPMDIGERMLEVRPCEVFDYS